MSKPLPKSIQPLHQLSISFAPVIETEDDGVRVMREIALPAIDPLSINQDKLLKEIAASLAVAARCLVKQPSKAVKKK